jgi:hypothetical protein
LPDQEKIGKVRLINVYNLAKMFARINKSITLIFFDACRENLNVDEYKGMMENVISDGNALYNF